ncbi:uncharacterized protein LOC143058256 [Mytilus galloprovincialis]|uniref:uncharacterized protein LOC143058256 n=1 Tax=Mytilus galloprovincialis TaxID=29158 RepID=UPI003F7BB6E8
MGLLNRQRVPSNLYLTQTSRDDDNYFIDYRSRHTNMEGNMNSNDLSNETASDLPDEIDYVPEFCNNAIFEKEFNIKRPQIRSESIPVFNNFGRPTAYRPDYI